MKTVSLFSGGGLLDLGFKEAGFDIIWAIDKDKSAVETYKCNIGDHIIHKDITKLDIDDIPDCDFIIGGPPCQDFSRAGKGEGENGKRGKLVWDYLKIIQNKKPKAFLFENVQGLASKRHIKTLEILLKQFEDVGYNVTYEVLNSWDYGVAQKRNRLIICGIRSDLNINFKFPEPSHMDYRTLTVKDVVQNLPQENNIVYPISEAQYNHAITKNIGKHYLSKPASTIRAKSEQIIVELNRRMTVRECLRCQSVPDIYIIPEHISMSSQYQIVGNGVPVKLAWYLADSLKRQLIKPKKVQMINNELKFVY